jgi:TetR/AcrR family transcriptional regulator
VSTTKRLPAEQRRLQILRSAIKVFAQHTYHGATTRGIAEQAGVTEALIYRYFGSKRVLFTEAIDATAGHIVAGLNRELHAHEADPRQALRACLAYYIGLLERSEDSARMLFLVLSELDAKDVRAAYLPHQRDALDTLASAITRWQEQGLVRQDVDIQSAAWLSFGSYIILALVKHSHGSKATLDIERALGLIQPYLCER